MSATNNTETKTLLKKGDLVQVIAGKEKGKQAKIKQMLLKRGAVVLEGVNMVKRHVKPTQANPQGGITSKEAPIHISNVMAVCPKTNKPTRLGVKMVGGKKVRVAKKSGATLA